ncbi:hypothetical protein TNCV_2764211 [Trichonephila clavipes]|nr:hypothetical protein TNCV_2764211 [Trichonephila clavipes]
MAHDSPNFHVNMIALTFDRFNLQGAELQTRGLSLCATDAVVISFPNESCQILRQVGHLNDRWRHHLSPHLQFRHGTIGEGNILQTSAPVVSAATTHKILDPLI